MQTVTPTIRHIGSTDWNGLPVRTTEPTSFGVTIEIGDGDKPGCDLFDMVVCNPEFLGDVAERSGWEWQDQVLVLATLSFESIRLAVERKIQSEAPFMNWPHFAEKMKPFMRWEFSGMPYPPDQG